MDIFTVSLFGHREIDRLMTLDNLLYPIIKELIHSKPYVNFLIGRNGEFDEYSASLIKRAQKEYGSENNDITLVLPYTVANIEDYEKYYDSIIIPESIYGAHFKSLIGMRNQWMIDKSDLVIVYVKKESGGAYTAKRYAEKLGKRIINVYENENFNYKSNE